MHSIAPFARNSIFFGAVVSLAVFLIQTTPTVRVPLPPLVLADAEVWQHFTASLRRRLTRLDCSSLLLRAVRMHSSFTTRTDVGWCSVLRLLARPSSLDFSNHFSHWYRHRFRHSVHLFGRVKLPLLVELRAAAWGGTNPTPHS